MKRRQDSVAARLVRCEAGNVAVVTGVLMTALVGFVGLGVEVGWWWLEKHRAQTAADAAAFAGGYELLEGGTQNAVATAGLNAARDNGFDASAAPIAVDVSTGAESVTAEVRYRLQPLLVGLLMDDDKVGITARATVLAKRAPRNTCLLALDPDDNKAFNLRGGSEVTLQRCGAHSNSAHSQGMCADGDSTLISSDVGYGVVGGTGGDCNKHDNFKDEDGVTSKPPRTNEQPLEDPYASVTVDAPATPGECTEHGNIELHDGETLEDGGVYCGDVAIKGDVSLPSNSTFTIAGGRLDITSTDANLTGSGVTFVLTEGAYVTVDGGTVDISAPTSGDLRGLLFYQDPETTPQSTPTSSFVGDADSAFNGALYFPNTEIYMAGEQSSGATCTQVIGRRLDIAGAHDFIMA